MDELEVLTSSRPDHLPLTAVERVTVKEQLMSFIEAQEAADTTVSPIRIPIDGAPRRHRPSRWIAMAGVAAAVAFVAVIVGSAGHGPSSLQAKVSAAQQLRSIAAEVELANPYPGAPFTVQSRTSITTAATGSAPNEPTGGASDKTTYVTGGGNYIGQNDGCSDGEACIDFMDGSVPDPFVPADGTAAEVRAGIERRVDAWMSVPSIVASRQWITLTAVERSLVNPGLSAAGRAELLRMVAENADVSSEAGATSALGLVGTRFTAAAPGGVLDLLIDPTDGYLLESRSTYDGEAFSAFAVPEADEHADDPTWAVAAATVEDITTSYRRPVELDSLPSPVAALAAEISAHADAIEAGLPNGGCVGAADARTAERWGIALPDGLTFSHCWIA